MSCQSHLHHTACPAGTQGLISGVGDLGGTGIEVRNFLLSQLPSEFLAAFVRRGGVVLYLLLLAGPCWTQLADVIPLLLDKMWEFCPQGLGKLMLGATNTAVCRPDARLEGSASHEQAAGSQRLGLKTAVFEVSKGRCSLILILCMPRACCMASDR